MKKQIFCLLSFSLVACGGGGSDSSNQILKTGFYTGDVFVTSSQDNECKFISNFSSYALKISENPVTQEASSLNVEKMFITSRGIFASGISATVPANASEVSFTDFNAELPTDIYTSDSGVEIHLSCTTKNTTVTLNANSESIDFVADSKTDCYNYNTSKSISCETSESGKLLLVANDPV